MVSISCSGQVPFEEPTASGGGIVDASCEVESIVAINLNDYCLNGSDASSFRAGVSLKELLGNDLVLPDGVEIRVETSASAGNTSLIVRIIISASAAGKAADIKIGIKSD